MNHGVLMVVCTLYCLLTIEESARLQEHQVLSGGRGGRRATICYLKGLQLEAGHHQVLQQQRHSTETGASSEVSNCHVTVS